MTRLIIVALGLAILFALDRVIHRRRYRSRIDRLRRAVSTKGE